MAIEFALWPACVKTHGFRDQLQAAASAGCDTLPIGRLTYRHLREVDGHAAADIRRMADDMGVRLGHYDGFARWAPYDFADGTPVGACEVFADSVDECLAMCDALGLPAICATGVYDPSVAELPRLVDAFGRFCERAASHGVQVDLECIPMWAVPDLATAWAIVGGAACDNGAILLDSWHFFRGAPDLPLLRELPAGSIRTVQLADAGPLPAGRELLEDCLRFRRLPDEGELPLGEFIRILAEKGGVTSIGPEIFSDRLDDLDAIAAAGQAVRSSREALAAAGFATD
ncbi:MAG: sugar phosphate isomerase/epimerase family protein [Parahaliea sp.]